MSHFLKLNQTDFKLFMENIYAWLPFSVDDGTAQRSRKWCTHKGDHWYNEGTLLDSLQFIPQTKKAEEQSKLIETQTNMTALERWFVNKTKEGNRNNMLLRYGYACVDLGQDIDTVKNNIFALNNKLSDPLPEAEILSTILITLNKKLSQRP